MGDLNVNLRDPTGERAEQIVDMMDEADLVNVAWHFLPRGRMPQQQRRWTWRQQHQGQWVSSQPDYIMAWQGDQQCFLGVALRSPRHHNTDHRAVVTTLRGGKWRRLLAYQWQHQINPLWLPFGPHGELETMFEQLKQDVIKLALREQHHNK